MSARTIYDDLRKAGMTHEGACAMLGNMERESGLRANNAQDGMTRLTDEQYTMHFNSTPEECYKDGVGYGLCQWTHYIRKRNLRQFAYNWDVSVGSEDMQTAFVIEELRTEYPALWKFLISTDELYTATEKICKEYERPAVNNIQVRYEAALKHKERIETEKTEPKPDMTILILQALLTLQGYQVELSGQRDGKTLEALKVYMKNMEGA